MSAKKQLTVKIVDDELHISIGIGLLAFSIQMQDNWSEDWYVSDIAAFAKELARELSREEEDGTTHVHRMFDAAADQVLEQGGEGVEEGDVETGIAIAKKAMKA